MDEWKIVGQENKASVPQLLRLGSSLSESKGGTGSASVIHLMANVGSHGLGMSLLIRVCVWFSQTNLFVLMSRQFSEPSRSRARRIRAK